MVAAVGRKIAKEHRARQTPHGKQTVKQLMRHGVSTNSLELSGDTKAGQADAMTACFSEYSKKVLNKSKSRRIPIRDQIKRAGDQLTREKPKQRERVKEAVHENR